jgi:hypothetical protein
MLYTGLPDPAQKRGVMMVRVTQSQLSMTRDLGAPRREYAVGSTHHYRYLCFVVDIQIRPARRLSFRLLECPSHSRPKAEELAQSRLAVLNGAATACSAAVRSRE